MDIMDKKPKSEELLIFLVRHGKAEDPAYSEEDFTRLLNARGRSDCRTLASELKQAGLFPDKVISSPAFRTAETARLLSRSLGLDPDAITYSGSLYLGRAADYISSLMLEHAAGHRALMIVGHNPDLGDLALQWSGGKVNHFPTSGCAVFGATWEDGKLSPGKLMFSRLSR